MPLRERSKGPRGSSKGGKGGKGRRTRSRDASTMIRRRPNIRIEDIDFKNVELLRKFTTEDGKILPRKHTNLPALFQRRLATAIKRARDMSLMR